MAVSKELLDILACPKCKGDLRLTEVGDGLICEQCKLPELVRDWTAQRPETIHT